MTLVFWTMIFPALLAIGLSAAIFCAIVPKGYR